MRRAPRSALRAIFAVSLCTMLAILGSIRAAGDNSRWGANYFPNVILTTQDGVKVKFYDDLIKSKIVAIDLIYTTCKYACPLETARMAQVQKRLADRMGKDVFFYSITIDPEHDTPAVLKAYAEKYHAGPGWLFLTGEAKDIELVSKRIGLYSDPKTTKDGHTPYVLIGNEATGQWMRNSATDNPDFLANVIGNWMNSWRTAKPGESYANARKLTIDPGQYGFSKHCAPCHTVGGGLKIGPDLAGVTKTRDRQWLARFIASPQKLLAEGDPIAVELFEKYKPVQMSSLNLAAADVAAIIDYIDGQSATADARTGTTSAEPAPVEAAGRTAFDVTGILEPYLEIQEALAADTLAGIAGNANAIRGAAAAAGPPAEPIRAASLALASASDVGKARAAFGALGDAIMVAAKASNSDLGKNVRVAYCPMAKKYWLQKGGEIRNPFYGRSMPDCGRFVAQIPDGLGTRDPGR